MSLLASLSRYAFSKPRSANENCINCNRRDAGEQKEFLSRVKDAKTVFVHVTCATDTSNVKVVFESVHQIIVKQMLGDSHLI